LGATIFLVSIYLRSVALIIEKNPFISERKKTIYLFI